MCPFTLACEYAGTRPVQRSLNPLVVTSGTSAVSRARRTAQAAQPQDHDAHRLQIDYAARLNRSHSTFQGDCWLRSHHCLCCLLHADVARFSQWCSRESRRWWSRCTGRSCSTAGCSAMYREKWLSSPSCTSEWHAPVISQGWPVQAHYVQARHGIGL